MEQHRISSIQPKLDPVPINVLVMRSWEPYWRKNEFCYLLVDAYGDAIQATAHHKDKDHFHSKIKLMSCYRIDNYICDTAKKLQLAATDATYIYLNPLAEDVVLLRNKKTDSLVKPQLLAKSLIVLGSTESVQTAEKRCDTGTATATFFNDAVVSLIGKECEEVVKEGYENGFEVPKSLSEAIV
ncbi:hypothetical protein L1987_18438 [Smallanthus sonchifolius]|uniref:Uncharacterized protein n=1 Tax=Smallanthus sonchifolius TaxID=185202 RepID=A0ACB9J0T3_9ASTR|nr:hypothetical protein L1987_18438 [Smallanthus sonchifolius]